MRTTSNNIFMMSLIGILSKFNIFCLCVIVISILLIISANKNTPPNLILSVSEESQQNVSKIRSAKSNRGNVAKVIDVEIYGKIDEISQLVLDGEISKAVELANLEADTSKRSAIYEKIASIWSQIDSRACLEWSMSISDEKDRLVAILMTINQSSKKDKDEIFNMLDLLPSGYVKDCAICQSVPDIILENPSRLIDVMSDLSKNANVDLVCRIVAAATVSENSFVVVSEVISSLPNSSMKGSLVTALIASVSENDPETAMLWFSENIGKTWGKDKFNTTIIANGFAAIDPLSGIIAADKLKDPKLKSKFLDQLGGKWAETSPEEAKQWLLSNRAESEYSSNKEFFDGIVQGLVFVDNNATIQFVENMLDSELREGARWAAISALADDDPELAGSYFLTFPTNYDSRNKNGMKVIVSKWLDRDANEASRWIRSLKASPLKDHAVQTLINNILNRSDDYAMATAWSREIRSAEIRNAIVSEINRKQNSRY